MTAIGGPVESVTIAGREFPATADSDTTRKLGGKENTIEMNGNGTGRLIKTPVPAGLKGLVISCDDSRQDEEYLQEIQAGDFVPVAITYASGITYQGTGQITGELNFSNMSTSCAFDLECPGVLSPQ